MSIERVLHLVQNTTPSNFVNLTVEKPPPEKEEHYYHPRFPDQKILIDNFCAYDTWNGIIHLNEEEDFLHSELYYFALCHEVAHSVDFKDVEEEYFTNPEFSIEIAEIVANLSAAVVLEEEKKLSEKVLKIVTNLLLKANIEDYSEEDYRPRVNAVLKEMLPNYGQS